MIPQWVERNFDALEKSLNGHRDKPVHRLRKQALEGFKKKGLPLPSDEEWKYTNVSEIAEINFKIPLNEDSVKEEELKPFLISGENISRIVFVDGKFSGGLSNLGPETNKINGLIITTLDQHLSAGTAAERNFEELPALVALNNTFSGGGFVLKTEKNIKIAGAIQLLFISTAVESDTFVAPRMLIDVSEGSELTVIETHAASGRQAYFSSPLTEIRVAENASLDYYKIGLESDQAFHLGNILLEQQRNSRASLLLFTLGGKLVRNEVHFKLSGSNSNAHINALTVLNGEQHVDNHTIIDHAEPHAESREKIKGIYAGKSKGVFNGTIIVRKDAQKTNAYQSNQTILLSKEASLDTKPQLKIWADDVKCTHGATVGQLDENALFYLRSRGLDKTTARNLLVHAFASEIFSSLNKLELKTYLEAELTKKLELIEPQ